MASTGIQINHPNPNTSGPIERSTTTSSLESDEPEELGLDLEEDDDDEEYEQPTRPLQHPPSLVPGRPQQQQKQKQTPLLLPTTLDPSNYPNAPKSLSGISLRAFLLGTTLGLSISSTTYLALPDAYTPLWRIPFFLSALCVFHFLEFFVTARFNTLHANVSAFLLSSNGWAYNVANLAAFGECLLREWVLGGRFGYVGLGGWLGIGTMSGTGTGTGTGDWFSPSVLVGIILVIIGQTVRTLAMAHAGSNFNHTVQVERREGHMLVSSGVYGILRHPSYFGFFWWGVGTQLVLGNVVCLVSHSVILWRFFHNRIQREEKYLTSFFGDDYVRYRKGTVVGIPGIH